MAISRGQMKRQLYMSGGIMDVVPREKALLGGIKKAVKKVAKGVKDFASSDLGKAALIGAAAFGIPGTSIGGLFGRASFGGAAPGVFGFGGIGNALAAGKAKLLPQVSLSDSMLSSVNKGLAKEGLTKGTLATLGIGAASVLAGLSAEEREEIEEAPASDRGPIVAEKLRQSLIRLGVKGEELDRRVAEGVSEYFAGTGAYAVGGRVGFQQGTPTGLGSLGGAGMVDEDTVVIITQDEDGNPKLIQVPKIQIIEEMKGPRDLLREEIMDGEEIIIPREKEAAGGKMDTASDNAMQAGGIEGLPVRENQKGVKELDLRKTGGFIPPVGIKEKADDIPAMLSNNEFVFTADAVRAAGDGDVNKGAQRMYDTMKKLENKVVRV